MFLISVHDIASHTGEALPKCLLRLLMPNGEFLRQRLILTLGLNSKQNRKIKYILLHCQSLWFIGHFCLPQSSWWPMSFGSRPTVSFLMDTRKYFQLNSAEGSLLLRPGPNPREWEKTEFNPIQSKLPLWAFYINLLKCWIIHSEHKRINQGKL